MNLIVHGIVYSSNRVSFRVARLVAAVAALGVRLRSTLSR